MSNQNGGIVCTSTYHVQQSCKVSLKSAKRFLEELRSQSYSDGRTDGRTQTITMTHRRFVAGDKKDIRVEYIRLFKPEITEFKRMGGRHWDKRTFGLTDFRTNEPSD